MPRATDDRKGSAGEELWAPPAYQELAERLRRRVESGELAVGARIPSEHALAELENVSRSTVREALRKLETSGILERVSPKILVVRSAGEEIVFREFNRALERRSVRFRDVYEALLLLEPEMVRYATERATPGDIAALRSNVERQAACIGDPTAWNEESLDFHRRLAEMTRNPALLVARASLSALVRPAIRTLYDTPEAAARIQRLNAALTEEMASRDPEGAGHAARKGVLDFGRSWQAAGHDMDELVSYLPTDHSAYASQWDGPAA